MPSMPHHSRQRAMLLVIFSLSLLLPLAAATVMDDETLRMIVVVHRHGDRTPVWLPVEYEDLWPQGTGQLTGLGMHQLWELGAGLREKLSETFLPAAYEAGTVYSRASNRDRTLQSAVSMLMALFPLGTGPSYNPGDDQEPALPSSFQPMPTHSIELERDYLMRGRENCARYKQYLEEDVYLSEEVQAEWAAHKDTIDTLEEAFGQETSIATFNRFYDYLFCSEQHGLQNVVSQEVYEDTVSLFDYLYGQQYVPNQYSRLIAGNLMGQIMDDMQDYALTVDTKMKAKLYSGHDITIGALLSLMGIEQTQVPPYAAHVLFELHRVNQEWMVRFTYNGDLLDLPFCTLSGDFCPLATYEAEFRAQVPDDPAAECAVGADDDNDVGTSSSPLFSSTLVISVLVVTVLFLFAAVAALAGYIYLLRSHTPPYASHLAMGGATAAQQGEEPDAIELDKIE